jgi:transcriptional regulator with XRE-family HTH domain
MRNMEYISCGDLMNRVREVRLQKGLTQDDLSRVSRVGQRHISLIENDLKPNLSLLVAKRISKALGKTVDYLWPD